MMKTKEVAKQICIGLGIALLLIMFILLIIFLPIVIDNNKIIHDIGEKYDVIVNETESEIETKDVENISIDAFKYISPELKTLEKLKAIQPDNKETSEVTIPIFPIENNFMKYKKGE